MGRIAREQMEKLENLRTYLKGLHSVAVAFSSGVDSTFLLKVAKDTLGEKVIAVTAQSCSFPKRELNEAIAFCKKEGITHFVCQSEELDIKGFAQNPKNRCYLCKKELFEKIRWNISWRDLIWTTMGIIDRGFWQWHRWGLKVR